jgi:hypothetical protein
MNSRVFRSPTSELLAMRWEKTWSRRVNELAA